MRRVLELTLLILLAWFVTPTAEAACSLSFATLNFGTYTGALQTGVTPATITCTLGTAYTIGLNAGTGIGATTTTRKMTGPGLATLSYQMFQDPARTINWGNTTGIDTVAGTGIGLAQTIYVYARMLAGQLVQPGTYVDTISTASASFTVTAVVQATCTFSATNMIFGVYTGVVLNAASALMITCTNGAAYTVGLSAGTSSGATVTGRLLTGAGGVEIGYSLFSDAARTVNWGLTSNTVAGTGNGVVQAIPVYGRLPAGRYVKPGTYTDTITATITY